MRHLPLTTPLTRLLQFAAQSVYNSLILMEALSKSARSGLCARSLQARGDREDGGPQPDECCHEEALVGVGEAALDEEKEGQNGVTRWT